MAKKKKTINRKKIDESILPKEVQIEFAIFLQDFPPKEFSRNLRSMVIEFMFTQLDGTTDCADRALLGMEGLFAVLDKAEDTWKKVDVMELWKFKDDDND